MTSMISSLMNTLNLSNNQEEEGIVESINNLTLSENKSIEHASTTVVALDFFTNIVRGSSINILLTDFCKMWNEDPYTAIKVIMNFRDIRNGKGEKFIPRIILFFLKITKPDVYNNIVRQICVDYGSWKDILHIYEWSVLYNKSYKDNIPSTHEINLFRNQLQVDFDTYRQGNMTSLSLAAKWSPNEKSHFNKKGLTFTRDLIKSLNISPREYRTKISNIRKKINVVEQQMTQGNWENIDFSKVPSVAHNNYKKAFGRDKNSKGMTNNDREQCSKNYIDYLNKLKSGDNTVKINTSGLHPHEIIKDYMNHCCATCNQTTESQWDDLVKKIRGYGTFSKTIAVSDVSGSMNGLPMDVSVALGILVSQCCDVDLFSNKVITFSEKPQLFHITGNTLCDKVNQVKNMEWGYSTNIQRVFDMLLATAKKFNITPDNMLEKVIIFTDMQFDQASGHNSDTKTTMQIIKKKFEDSGYNIPKIICWNLRTSTSKSVPFEAYDENVGLLSGFSAELLKQIMTTDDFSPMTIFNNTMEPYKPVYNPTNTDKYDLNTVDQYINKIKGIINK